MIRCAVLAILAIFCLYRIARFTPAPLDSANTLRPILNTWFVAFLNLYSRPEAAYSDWKYLCVWLLLIPPALALLYYVHENWSVHVPLRFSRVLLSPWTLFAAMSVCLFVCRFSTLLEYQLNPDEGEFLSGAHKLFYDGNFYRAEDCGSSGPFNIYPLMLPAIFGFSPDYASSRIIVLLAVVGTLYFLCRTVRLLSSESVARLSVLPAFGVLAVVRDANFLHYNSEYIPIFLLSIGLFLTVRVLRNPALHRWPLLWLGSLTSLAFLSKMQSVPIMLSFALIAIAYIHVMRSSDRFWRPAYLYVVGTLPILVLHTILCLAGNVWHNFVFAYLISNQRYVNVDADFLRNLHVIVQYIFSNGAVGLFFMTFAAMAVTYAIARFRAPERALQTTFLPLLLVSSVVFGLALYFRPSEEGSITRYIGIVVMIAAPVCFIAAFRKGSFGIDPVRWFGFVAAFSAAAALFAINKPHRLFPHYLLFLIIPISAGMAWMLMRHAQSTFVLVFVTLVATFQLYAWGSESDQRFRTVVPTIRPPEGNFIRSLVSPKGRIFVWGWTPDPYLGSGHVTATRDLNLFYQFIGPPEVTHYYRTRLLHDLQNNPPDLFIDAIGPASWSFTDRARYNFEQFPDINAFVNDKYIRVLDVYNERYFLRRDLSAKVATALKPQLCSAASMICFDRPQLTLEPDAALVPAVKSFPPVHTPADVLIQATFTPFGPQTDNATVFANEAVPNSMLGFRFQTIGGNRYRLILGTGKAWMFSKSVWLAPGKSANISIELKGSDVYLRANGTAFDDMHMPSPMADAPGPVTVGSWLNGLCPLSGTINFFQIVDLTRSGSSQ